MRLFVSSLAAAVVVAAFPRSAVEMKQVKRQTGFTIQATEMATGSRLIPVVVGGQQDTFIPNSVTAAPGDIVQFQFNSGNHTVTQSAADQACVPLQATVPGAIHSGHIPFTAGQATVGTFNMPVVSTDPMFLYCATGPHCQEGQVLVINPINDQQILDYANLAAAAPNNIDGNVVSGGAVASIPVEFAAFVPVAEEQAAPPPPAEAAPAPAPIVDPALLPGTTTVLVTVTAADAPLAATPAPVVRF